MEEVFSVIGKVLAVGGGAAGVAYLLFKVFATKWIETKFSEQLEDYKYKINSLFNRITKIHEKEFEVLPEMWKRLLDAYSKVVEITLPMQEYPDLNRMPPKEFEDFLAKSNLTAYHKEQLAKETDKNRYYQDIHYKYRVVESRKLIHEFHSYVLYNKIFLETSLYDKFREVDNVLSQAVQTYEEGKEYDDYKQVIEAYKLLDKKVEAIIEQIEKLVQERLHYRDAK